MTAADHRLQPLLDPRSIAIVGASDNPARIGGMPLALCRQHGFEGALYPVNPKYSEIDGLPCYPEIEAIPEPVDLVALAVSAAQVVPQLRRAAARGCRAAVVFASGFAESGTEEGRRLQDELEAVVAELGIPVAGPNCMGFANLRSHAYTAFASVLRNLAPAAEDRSVALITQSGNVASTVYAQARKLGVGFGLFVNTGNEASVEFSEYLEYFAAEPEIRTVIGYVEGLRDGARFRKVARALAEKQVPLVLLKIGDSAKGAEAAASHTAALAGSQAIYRAAFEELNVIQASDLSHLADIAYLARFRARSAGKRIAILTISGALGALLSDKFSLAGAEIPTLSDEVQDLLRRGIPDYGMVANPVDLTGNVVNDHAFFGAALAALQAAPEVDQVVLYIPGYFLDRVAPALIAAAPGLKKLVTVIDTLGASCRAELEAAGFPVFEDNARAVAALASWTDWSLRRPAAEAARPAAPAPEAEAILARARAEGRRALNEVEGKALLACYGAPIRPEFAAQSAEAAVNAAERLGYPVVVKVLSADILHKSDIGGVRLALQDAEAVAAAFAEVMAKAGAACPGARLDGVVVQKMERPGVEMLLGLTRDPVFGPVLTLGLGGIFTEVFRDIRHALVPLSAEGAREQLARLRGYPLLRGVRGKPAADIGALACLAETLSRIAEAHPEIAELEINPVMVWPEGEGVGVLDCLVTFADAAGEA